MSAALGFGVIGAGRMGKLHLDLLQREVEGATVVCLHEPDPGRAAAAVRGLEVEAVADPAAVIGDPRVEAVAICSATDTHAELIEACAAAGKPTFCEKPLAGEPAAIERTCAAVERSGIPFQVGFNRRFDPAHRAVRDAVAAGRVGEPQIARISSRDPEPPSPEYTRVSGGLFLDMTAHDFDLARFLTGSEVREVFARGRAIVDPGLAASGDVDTALLSLLHENGCMTSIDNSRRAAYGYDQRAEVFGAGGMACSENPPAFPGRLLGAERDAAPPPRLFFLERYRESYRLAWEHFVECLRGGRQPAVGIADARAALALALAARRSLAEGRPVAVAP